MQTCRPQQARQICALQSPLPRPSVSARLAVSGGRRRWTRLVGPRRCNGYFEEQGESNDTMSTSYGDVETIGREAKTEPEPASSSYSTPDGPSDHDREEASRALQEVKEDITAPTGDLDADMEQLNVEELLENVADPKQFGKRGEPLFFGQLLFLILIVFPPTFFKTLVTSLGLVATIGGIFTTFVGIRDLGRNFYPFTSARAGNKLVTKGFFRYVRHPMYCGLCALTFGLCAITGSQARLALSIAFWFVVNHMSDLEEVEMERVHGEQYTEYKSHVSKLIPGIY